MKHLDANIKEGEIAEYLKNLKPEIDGIIEKYIPRKATREWLEFVFGKPRYSYNIEAAQKSINDPVWEFMDRGGKRWRPILFLLISEAVGGDIEKIKDFAIIPEIVHEGTIIIDDIEDQGELRRGKPCLHLVFGEDMAVNVGNLMYYLPILTLLKNKDSLKPEVLIKAYEIYVQEMINVSLGQGTDIYWHKGQADNIEENDYLQMCAFKTGCLSRMAAKLAVVFSEGSDELIEKIGHLAESMGVAFQIQDDILDIVLEGEEREKFGKVFGNDIKEGKRTLMVIYALQKASLEDRARLIEILNKHTDDLKEREIAIEIIKKYGSIEYAKKIAKEIIADSWREADQLLPNSKAKDKLREFINYLIERKK